MRVAYRVLAYLVALGVVVQASMIAFAVFGLGKWVDDGGTLDKATMESDNSGVTGSAGFAVHSIDGQMVIPALALILLIVSFFAKVPGGSKWAGFVLLAVVVQVFLGFLSHTVPWLGALHGINALILFGLAVTAGMRASARTAAPSEPELV